MNFDKVIKEAIIKALKDLDCLTKQEVRRAIYQQSKLCIPKTRVKLLLDEMVAEGVLVLTNSNKGSWRRYWLPPTPQLIKHQ